MRQATGHMLTEVKCGFWEMKFASFVGVVIFTTVHAFLAVYYV